MDDAIPGTPDPWLGKTIADRFLVEERLGKGGMGAVYKSRHLELKRPVAIKMLLPQMLENLEVTERFKDEAITASRIGNDHIINIYDIYSASSPPFIVMEYLDGATFDKHIHGPNQPLVRIADIAAQICDALIDVHDKGIVHRDLKPENIMLINKADNPDFVKILDFGIAKIKKRSSLLVPAVDFETPGRAMGTVEYMSPEQCRGEVDAIDARTDIYALGAIVYFGLTGVPPFCAESEYLLMVKHCQEPVPSVAKWRADLPPEIDSIIAKAMAKDPKDRYPNALELKRALWPHTKHLSSNPPPPIEPIKIIERVPETEPLRVPIRRWVIPALMISAVMAVIAFAAAWIASKPRSYQAPGYLSAPAMRPSPGAPTDTSPRTPISGQASPIEKSGLDTRDTSATHRPITPSAASSERAAKQETSRTKRESNALGSSPRAVSQPPSAPSAVQIPPAVEQRPHPTENAMPAEPTSASPPTKAPAQPSDSKQKWTTKPWIPIEDDIKKVR